MDRAGNDHQFFIVTFQKLEGITAQIAGMGLVAMDHQHGAVNLIRVGEQAHIHEGGLCIDSPAIIGIERTGMITAFRLVIVIVIFYEERRVLRKRIDHAARSLIAAVFIVFRPLGVDCFTCRFSRFFTVGAIKVTIAGNAGHIVHSRSYGGFDPCIYAGCLQGHAAPAADTDDADPVGIDQVTAGQEVDSRLEILYIDVR